MIQDELDLIPFKFISIEDKLYDISGILHPMGRYILYNL